MMSMLYAWERYVLGSACLLMVICVVLRLLDVNWESILLIMLLTAVVLVVIFFLAVWVWYV